MSRAHWAGLFVGITILAYVIAWFFGWGTTDKDSWDAPAKGGKWRV